MEQDSISKMNAKVHSLNTGVEKAFECLWDGLQACQLILHTIKARRLELRREKCMRMRVFLYKHHKLFR